MRKKRNPFFDHHLRYIDSWIAEFSAMEKDGTPPEKAKSFQRFTRDCALLKKDMTREHDPSLCDSVDLTSRWEVLSLTRRRLLNVVHTEKAAY